ncbi:hypothetical protein KDK77_00155 [bacterium]|nr:hypothetical protein [bacterium]MCP5461585.1 hypothetical protein [bacterium]
MNTFERGISLLEVLVTITIMVIMAALTIPMMTQFGENLSLASSCRQVSNMLRLAQRYAINYNAVYRVDISPLNNWAAVYSNDSGGTVVGKIYYPPSLIRLATTTVNGITAADLVSDSSIVFYPRGSASTSAYIHVVRANSVFGGVKDSFDVTISDPVSYYQSGFNYEDVSADEKERCYTVQVYANTGRVKLHRNGVGGPWE